MGFAENLNKLCARAGDKAEMVVRKAALDLERGMIMRTPVDTGRAKGAWNCGVGVIDNSEAGRRDTTPKGDLDEAGAISAADRVLQGWKPGQTIWLTLSLPYARRLENGWSKQSPNGMVRLSVQEYSEHIRKAVESIK